jgi:hypothetical protein
MDENKKTPVTAVLALLQDKRELLIIIGGALVLIALAVTILTTLVGENADSLHQDGVNSANGNNAGANGDPVTHWPGLQPSGETVLLNMAYYLDGDVSVYYWKFSEGGIAYEYDAGDGEIYNREYMLESDSTITVWHYDDSGERRQVSLMILNENTIIDENNLTYITEAAG